MRERFAKLDAETSKQIANEVSRSVRAGEQITRTAERLMDARPALVRIPQHVAEMRDAAQQALSTGNRQAYGKAVEKWRARVEKLGQGAGKAAGSYTMRSATQALVKDLKGATEEQVSKAIDRWTLERARYSARMIARTETVQAFRDVTQRQTAAQDFNKGLRWQTSGAHPVIDVCDVLASQDLYGLGPGGYPVDKIPQSPHPHCTCLTVPIVDEKHFDREIAKATGKAPPPETWKSGKHETGNEWLRKQPTAAQERMLGPTRAAMLRDGRNVLDASGKPIAVHVLTGSAKPARMLGPAVSSGRVVMADRASMVQPFHRLAP